MFGRLFGFAESKPVIQYVVSEQPYEVLDHPTARERAEFLHALEKWAHEYLDAAVARWPGDPRIARVRQRWTGRLNEVVGADDAAYSRGKRTIYVCCWDKKTEMLESPRNAQYILLHELAHVANTTYGHDAAFWRTFKILLEMAEKLGAYTDDDHAPEQSFCGHKIGRSPAACVMDGTCDSAM